MKNLSVFIILTLISYIYLKLEESNYNYIIEVQKSSDCYIYNNSTVALELNIFNPIDIFGKDYENIIFDIVLWY